MLRGCLYLLVRCPPGSAHGQTGAFLYLEPIITVVVAAFLIGESILLATLIGVGGQPAESIPTNFRRDCFALNLYRDSHRPKNFSPNSAFGGFWRIEIR